MLAWCWLQANIQTPNVEHKSPSPRFRSQVVPFDHQLHAKAVALDTLESRFRGLIIADPPGLGKTLPALEAIAESRRV